MERQQTIDDLESLDSRRHHALEVQVERLGRLAMAAVVAVALLGGLGPGVFGRQRIESVDRSLQFEYASVVHREAPAEFVVRLTPTADATTVRLRLSRSFCDHATIESIIPRPLEERGGETEVVYVFAVERDSERPTTVIFRFSYDDFGRFDNRITGDNGSPIDFRQFVLP